jgi:hypothetical protein
MTMPKYILTYHQPKGYVPGSDTDAMVAWQSYFDRTADHVVDLGQPVFDRRSIGEVGDTTQLGGYSIVDAADFDDAMMVAQQCPSVQYGGGVQIGELADVPVNLPAPEAAANVTRG